MKHLPLIVLPLMLGSCFAIPFAKESRGVGTRSLEPWGDVGGNGTLYARDGSPVPNQPTGAITTTDTVSRELGPDDGSRPYLLELYQTAVDQKEKLEFEVGSLQRVLDEAEEQRKRDEAERDSLKLEIAALQQEVARLEQQNMDIAGRLVTAQIRRLEAEKLLLETTLEWSRYQDKRDNLSREGIDSPENDAVGEGE